MLTCSHCINRRVKEDNRKERGSDQWCDCSCLSLDYLTCQTLFSCIKLVSFFSFSLLFSSHRLFVFFFVFFKCYNLPLLAVSALGKPPSQNTTLSHIPVFCISRHGNTCVHWRLPPWLNSLVTISHPALLCLVIIPPPPTATHTHTHTHTHTAAVSTLVVEGKSSDGRVYK